MNSTPGPHSILSWPRSLMGLALAAAFVAVPATLAAQTGRLTGSVISATDAQALSGVQVSIPGTGLGAVTGPDGRYQITEVPPGDYTVQARLIGYGTETAEVTIEAGATTRADFELRTQALEMEDIIVTGTAGGARRREIGNAVTSLSSEDLELVPAARPADLLQGRAPGITILENSGMVGTGTTIRLRGSNTLQNNQQPLVYVDGIRMSTSEMGSYPDEANQSANPFDAIDPESIDRIEVVSGPSATTMYGTEASGGVIQIFTKKGSGAMAPQWTASVEQGVNNLAHVGPDNDPTQLGLECGKVDPVPEGCPTGGSYLRNGHRQKYYLSVRGGAGELDYFISGNFQDQNGVIDPQGQTRWGLRGNFGFQPAENLRIQFNNSLTTRDITWIPDGNNAEGLLLNVFRGDAGYTPNNNDSLTLAMDLQDHIQQFTSGVNLTWTPGSGLTQSLKAGVDYVQTHYEETKPFEYFSTPEGNRESDEYTNRLLTLDYTGSWRTDLTDRFQNEFSWGGQMFEELTKRLDGFGERFAGPGDKLVEDGASTEIFDEDLLRVVNGGFFFQNRFGVDDRLFVTAGLRVDGHSSFGENFGLEPYPKVQAAYMLSDLEMWPEWWETMKLRAAWGESGRSPGPFDQLRTWSSVSGDEGRPGVTPSNIGDPDIGPERTRELEGGFEAAAWDGRASLSVTYFDQTTHDALIAVQPVPSQGFTNTQLQNVGEIANDGFETSINVGVLRQDAVDWDVGFQYSNNNSEVLDLAGLTSIDVGWRQEVQVGHPIPVMVQERVRNPDAPWDEAVFADDSIIGPTMPQHSWSVNTTLTVFDRLTFKALGEAHGGHYLSSGTAYQNVRRGAWPGQPAGASASCTEIQDRIQAGSTEGLTAWDRALCDPDATSYGMWTWPADFFKLRSASLTYRLPETLLTGGIRNASITLSGRNLFTGTDYPGVDPEAFEDGSCTIGCLFRQEYYNLPPARSFLMTLNVNW